MVLLAGIYHLVFSSQVFGSYLIINLSSFISISSYSVSSSSLLLLVPLPLPFLPFARLLESSKSSSSYLALSSSINFYISSGVFMI
jgi:hypothetical protein